MIDKSQFVDGCVLRGARKDTPLPEILVERNWLTPEKKQLVDQLLKGCVKKNDGDVSASLADAVRNDNDPERLIEVFSQLSVDESRPSAERYELLDGPQRGRHRPRLEGAR